MENPAGEALPMSSSSESEEDEERAAKIRAMAAKFNPASIYGDTDTSFGEKKADEKKVEDKDDEEESFSFGFLAGQKKDEATTEAGKPAKKKQLYNREDRIPKYLPEESGLEGPGIHKDGPLKGLPKFWQQQSGLRQRPKESNKPQFVEVSVDHVPPSQRYVHLFHFTFNIIKTSLNSELPEFVQDLPDEDAILKAASMAVRDYQKKQLYNQKNTKYEEYMRRRREDTRFTAEQQKEIAEKMAEKAPVRSVDQV